MLSIGSSAYIFIPGEHPACMCLAPRGRTCDFAQSVLAAGHVDFCSLAAIVCACLLFPERGTGHYIGVESYPFRTLKARTFRLILSSRLRDVISGVVGRLPGHAWLSK